MTHDDPWWPWLVFLIFLLWMPGLWTSDAADLLIKTSGKLPSSWWLVGRGHVGNKDDIASLEDRLRSNADWNEMEWCSSKSRFWRKMITCSMKLLGCRLRKKARKFQGSPWFVKEQQGKAIRVRAVGIGCTTKKEQKNTASKKGIRGFSAASKLQAFSATNIRTYWMCSPTSIHSIPCSFPMPSIPEAAKPWPPKSVLRLTSCQHFSWQIYCRHCRGKRNTLYLHINDHICMYNQSYSCPFVRFWGTTLESSSTPKHGNGVLKPAFLEIYCTVNQQEPVTRNFCQGQMQNLLTWLLEAVQHVFQLWDI